MSIDVNVQNDLVIVTESSEDITVNVSNAAGVPGPAGEGVPIGGSAGQVLKKLSATNYDTYWAVEEGGGVPYSGATGDVDLGEYELKAGQVEFDQTPTGTAGVGVMRWNDADGTVDLGLKGGNVTLQVGQEQVLRVVNKTGADLLESQYRAVRIRLVSEGGAQGQRLAVVLAQGDNDPDSTTTIGIVTETIANNQEGFITTSGEVRGINTTGSLQGETWLDGDIIYLSTTVPGGITKVKPTAPDHMVVLGYVIYAHANNGKIFVKVDNGYELGELHDVYVPTPSNNDGIFWNTANSRYQNNSIAGVLGYTPTSGSGATGQVAYWNGTNSQTGSNNLFWDAANSRLGIGTNAPGSKLSVITSGGPNFIVSQGFGDVSTQSGYISVSKGRGSLSSPAALLSGDILGSINFGGYFTPSNIATAFAITAIASSDYTSLANPVNLVFRKFDTTANSTELMRLYGSTGNLAIGGTFVSDGGQRLQVYGDAFIKGSGSTSATIGLQIQNSGGLDMLRLLNDTTLKLGSQNIDIFPTANGSTASNAGRGLIISTNASSQSGVGALKIIGGYSSALGNDYGVWVSHSFTNGTGGTATHSGLLLNQTINQTGGANGITRGLYVSPTLTAAADWRSIEWSNNSGWGLYGAGTAENFLGGNLTISRSQNANTILTISNNTSAVNSSTTLRVQNTNTNNFADFAKYSSTTTAYKIISANDAIIYNGGGGGDISILNDFPTGRIKFSAGGSSPAQMTLTAAGRLLLGTVSEETFRLDVNGTARVSGNMLITKSAGTITELNVVDTTNTSTSGAFVKTQAGTTQGYLISNAPATTAYKTMTSGSIALFKSATAGDITILNDHASGNITMAAGGSSTAQVTIKANGSVNYAPMATPGTASAGDVYYDSTTNKLRCYNGTTWNDLF